MNKQKQTKHTLQLFPLLKWPKRCSADSLIPKLPHFSYRRMPPHLSAIINRTSPLLQACTVAATPPHRFLGDRESAAYKQVCMALGLMVYFLSGMGLFSFFFPSPNLWSTTLQTDKLSGSQVLEVCLGWFVAC